MSNWKETQYPGYYVSDSGEVKGPSGKILKAWKQKRGGYPAVKISQGQGNTCTVTVHSLVLAAFIGPKPDGYEACHRNGNPEDNRAANLYWGTRTDNMRDMYRHGTWAKSRPTNTGSLHHGARLTEADVLDIRRRYIKGSGNGKQLAEEYRVSYYTIWDIVTGRSWTHV